MENRPQRKCYVLDYVRYSILVLEEIEHNVHFKVWSKLLQFEAYRVWKVTLFTVAKNAIMWAKLRKSVDCVNTANKNKHENLLYKKEMSNRTRGHGLPFAMMS